MANGILFPLTLMACLGCGLLIAAGSVYVVGTFLLTVVYHVPRNNALDAVDPHGAEASQRWDLFVPGWTAMNHVRGLAALIAAGLLGAALYVA